MRFERREQPRRGEDSGNGEDLFRGDWAEGRGTVEFTPFGARPLRKMCEACGGGSLHLGLSCLGETRARIQYLWRLGGFVILNFDMCPRFLTRFLSCTANRMYFPNVLAMLHCTNPPFLYLRILPRVSAFAMGNTISQKRRMQPCVRVRNKLTLLHEVGLRSASEIEYWLSSAPFAPLATYTSITGEVKSVVS